MSTKRALVKILDGIYIFAIFLLLLHSCSGDPYTRSEYNQRQVDKCVRVLDYSREKCELIVDNPRINWFDEQEDMP